MVAAAAAAAGAAGRRDIETRSWGGGGGAFGEEQAVKTPDRALMAGIGTAIMIMAVFRVATGVGVWGDGAVPAAPPGPPMGRHLRHGVGAKWSLPTGRGNLELD